ncbi:MAG: zeta toxin family protein, partial [Eubacterium sp.]
MKYTIIAGVNGVGKSSLTGVLKREKDDLGTIINVDEYAAKLMDPKLSQTIRNIQAGRLALTKIKECLKNHQNFTQETTLSSHQPIKTAQKALEEGYKIELYYIGLDSSKQSVDRVKNRVENGGHDI